MPEWLKDLLVAIGGGSIVLIGILTIFKQLFLKLFETGIETSFEKIWKNIGINYLVQQKRMKFYWTRNLVFIAY